MASLDGVTPLTLGQYQGIGGATGATDVANGISALGNTIASAPVRAAQGAYLGAETGQARANTAILQHQLATRDAASALLSTNGGVTNPANVQRLIGLAAGEPTLAEGLAKVISTGAAASAMAGGPGAVSPQQRDAFSAATGVAAAGNTFTGQALDLSNRLAQAGVAAAATRYSADQQRIASEDSTGRGSPLPVFAGYDQNGIPISKIMSKGAAIDSGVQAYEPTVAGEYARTNLTPVQFMSGTDKNGVPLASYTTAGQATSQHLPFYDAPVANTISGFMLKPTVAAGPNNPDGSPSAGYTTTTGDAVKNRLPVVNADALKVWAENKKKEAALVGGVPAFASPDTPGAQPILTSDQALGAGMSQTPGFIGGKSPTPDTTAPPGQQSPASPSGTGPGTGGPNPSSPNAPGIIPPTGSSLLDAFIRAKGGIPQTVRPPDTSSQAERDSALLAELSRQFVTPTLQNAPIMSVNPQEMQIDPDARTALTRRVEQLMGSDDPRVKNNLAAAQFLAVAEAKANGSLAFSTGQGVPWSKPTISLAKSDPTVAQRITNSVQGGGGGPPAPAPAPVQPAQPQQPAPAQRQQPAQPQQPQPQPTRDPNVLPPEAAAILKEGVPQAFASGAVWTLQNGKPVQLKPPGR